MPFAPNGVYTPATGAESATPGAVIRSATWNSIFTDISTLGLTVLGKAMWVTNPPRTVASGSFTVLTSDNAVYVTGSSPTITLPASTLVTSPFALIGAATVFGGNNNAVISPSGGDVIPTPVSVGNLTLGAGQNNQLVFFYPCPGGYEVGYLMSPKQQYVNQHPGVLTSSRLTVDLTATGDSLLTVVSQSGFVGGIRPMGLNISGVAGNASGATFGLYTGAGATGSLISASATATISVTNATTNTAGNYQFYTAFPSAGTLAYSPASSILYFNVVGTLAATVGVSLLYSTIP